MFLLSTFFVFMFFSGFNIEGRCWEPVLDHSEILVDVKLTERSTVIGIRPKTPIQVICFESANRSCELHIMCVFFSVHF